MACRLLQLFEQWWAHGAPQSLWAVLDRDPGAEVSDLWEASQAAGNAADVRGRLRTEEHGRYLDASQDI